jgi:hypothetical protein
MLAGVVPPTVSLAAMPLAALPLLLLAPLSPRAAAAPQVTDQLTSVPATRWRVESPFWAPRIEANRARTLPLLLDGLEEHGYLANFDLAAKHAKEGHRGGPEADARVYDAIRAVALALANGDDEALRARVAAWIPRIAAAQEEDGYLHTFVAVERPGARFAELATNRELECLGALIEAGIAWERATADAALFDVAVRAAERLDRAMYDEGLVDPPGRPAVEHALVALYHRTGREDWVWLADDLLRLRGSREGRTPWGAELQDAIPPRKLMTASGDTLGLLGLQRGLLEVFAAAGDQDCLAAVLNVWKDLTRAKSYATGGVGVEPDGRVPAGPGELASAAARCEPAASVALVREARRLLALTRQAAFADFEERVLYNALAAGAAPDGTRFLAACPLAALGGIERAGWLDDPRTLTALAGFYPELATGAILHDDDDVYVAHYLGGAAELTLPGGAVRVELETDFPWTGRVEIRVAPEKPMTLSVHARVPEWVGDRVTAGVDDSIAEITIDRGDQHGMWLTWQRTWTGQETLVIELPVAPRRVDAPAGTPDAGRVALARGPLLYALEGVDHRGRAGNLALPPDAVIEEAWSSDVGAMVLHADGREARAPGQVAVGVPVRLTAIPYALCATRGRGALAVWLATR